MSKKRRKAKGNKGGRPEWEPTLEQRNQVAVAAGGGMSHEDIAIALGVSRGTLEKHCAHELSHGANAKRMEVLQAQHKAAVTGNVSAQKAYLSTVPHLAATPAPKPGAPAKPSKKGKKEEQADAAKAAVHDPNWHGLLKPPSETLN